MVDKELSSQEFMIRRSLLENGVLMYLVDRVVSTTKKRIKKFLGHVVYIPTTKKPYASVKQFYNNYEPTKELSKPVENSDKIILAEAIELKSKLFLSLNEHFHKFTEEIDNEFGILVVSQFNCGDCTREWRWQ